MKKDKFILTIGAPEWRLPMFINLSKSGYDVFVITDNDNQIHENIINLNLDKNLFGFFPDKKLFKHYNKGVCILDRRLFVWLLQTKIIKSVYLWGLGLGNNKLVNKIRYYLAKKSLGVITYMPFGQQFEDKNAGYIVNSIFNTPKYLWENSNKLLFIGSLKKRKRLDLLFHALKLAKEDGYEFILEIIGDGPEKSNLIALSIELNINNNVNFHGHISKAITKHEIIKGCSLSISLGQAGLSILESMSFGLPFLTAKSAISGGEIENIIDNYNGYLLEDYKNPTLIAFKLIQIKNDNSLEHISRNAFNYYSNFANGELMVTRFKKIVG